MIYELDIKEPIWKNRSIGISLDQMGPDDLVKISISYKNKQGRRLYPHDWLVRTRDIHQYPIKHKIKAIGLHEVPIADLDKLNLNNNLTQQTMLFDNKAIDKIRKDNQERTGQDMRKTIEAGENLVTQSNARIEKSKKSGVSMVVVDFQKSPDYKPLTTRWVLTGNGSDIAKSKIVEYLERSFNYILQPCADENDLIKQIAQFNGKNLKIAVQVKESLWDNDKSETIVVSKPEYWYSGAANDNKFKVDHSKMVVALKGDDLKRYNDIATLTGTAPRRAGDKDLTQPVAETSQTLTANTTNEPTKTTGNSANDDLPF